MKITFNPLSGQFDFTGGSASLLNLKGQAATVGALPLVGNTVGDVYQVVADSTFRVWDGLAWDNLGTLQGPAGAAGLGVQLVYAVGNWIAPFEGIISTAGSALTANTIALYPFTVRRSITVNNLAARVLTVAAGSNVQLALYASDANNKVTGNPLGATGNLSGAVAQNINGPVTAFTMQAGLVYWMGINSNGTPTMYGPQTTNTYPNYILGGPAVVDALGATTFTLTLRTVAQTFGTWPDLTAVTPTVVSGSANAQKGAIVAMQISALP
jgi:hypothetical protein